MAELNWTWSCWGNKTFSLHLLFRAPFSFILAKRTPSAALKYTLKKTHDLNTHKAITSHMWRNVPREVEYVQIILSLSASLILSHLFRVPGFIFPFLSFSFFFFFAGSGWVRAGIKTSIRLGAFIFLAAKLDWRVWWYLSFFPEPQQRRGEGRLSKAASKDLDKHHLHQGLRTRLVVSYCQTEGQGPGGAAALWASLAARPWEQEIWPVWEEARARSRITLLFFPDSCHPCTSSCFHEISVERFPQSGKSHREILSSSAPSLCCRKWWRLF